MVLEVVEVLVVEAVEVDHTEEEAPVEVVVAHVAVAYSQVVGVQVVVEDGRGLVVEDVPVVVILGVVEDQEVVVGVQEEVVGFILVVDIVVVLAEDGHIQNLEEDGDIVERNLLCWLDTF